MKLSVLAVAFALVSSPVLAESVVIRCPLTRQYSAFQVNLLFNQATSALGAQEASKIYGKYASLKAECAANAQASRVITVSEKLKSVLKDYGLDIHVIASRN